MSLDRNAAASVLAGAVCISLAPVLVKAMVLAGMGPTSSAFWRCAIGGVALAGFALVRGTSMRLPRKALALALAAGFAFCLDLWVWHRSVRDAGAGLATILGNTQVFLTALASWMLYREPVGKTFVFASASAVVGIVMLVGFGSDVAFTATYVRGIVYGLLTALCYTTFLLTLRAAGRAAEGASSLAIMVWVSFAAGAALGGVALVDGAHLPPPNAQSWAYAVALAVVAQAAGWWAISRSLPRLPGATSALLLLLQPVLATLWGAWLFDERLAVLQVVGAAVTLAAIYAGSTASARPRTPEKKPDPGVS